MRTTLHRPCLRLLAMAAVFTLGGCGRPDPRPALEVVTRAGSTLIMAHVDVNYQRICDEGKYAADGDPDAVGLRSFVPTGDALADVRGRNAKDIPWSSIASIRFAEPNGETGPYCADRPNAIWASVTFSDGRQERQNLLDTTDRGLAGVTDHGPVVVPLREVARLKVIKPGDWHWVDTYDPADPTFTQKRRDRTTLHVATADGGRHDLTAPWIEIMTQKKYGERTLDPIPSSADGLPISRGGVSFAVPWSDLSHVEISNGDPQIATLTFLDRHRETGELPKFGSLHSSSFAADFRNVSTIDISLSPAK